MQQMSRRGDVFSLSQTDKQSARNAGRKKTKPRAQTRNKHKQTSARAHAHTRTHTRARAWRSLTPAGSETRAAMCHLVEPD